MPQGIACISQITWRTPLEVGALFTRTIHTVDNNGNAVVSAHVEKGMTKIRSLSSANIAQFMSRTRHSLFARY